MLVAEASKLLTRLPAQLLRVLLVLEEKRPTDWMSVMSAAPAPPVTPKSRKDDQVKVPTVPLKVLYEEAVLVSD